MTCGVKEKVVTVMRLYWNTVETMLNSLIQPVSTGVNTEELIF